jgi:hypothetical protein
VKAAVAYDANKRKAVLDPAADLVPGASYTATVTAGARDLAGNPLAAGKAWRFTVKP